MEEALTTAKVVIVLSTYNGAKYISEQVESIRSQEFSDWKLLVRDDGSSDDTVAIVHHLSQTDPRIIPIADSHGNLGAAASFGVLLERALEANADYVALCDQDDIWCADKLGSELERIQVRESELGKQTPLLVHSDLRVVREDLSLIHPSYLAFQGLHHQTSGCLGILLIQNFVTGCTTVVNRALLRVAVPLPPVIMHDWWLALCACASGEILYLSQATVLYRQHGRNVLGSRGIRAAALDSLRRPFLWWRRSGAMLDLSLEQARELRQRLEEAPTVEVPREALLVLNEVCTTFSTGTALARLGVVMRHRIRPRTFWPFPVRFYLQVLLWSRSSARHRMLADERFETAVKIGESV
jgi:rhamnosyltransferase